MNANCGVVNVIVTMGFVGIVNVISMTSIVHLSVKTKIVRFGRPFFVCKMGHHGRDKERMI